MTASVLLDTNVLVYAYDRTEPAKQERAAELLEALASAREGAVSTQVLSEFFVTVTRKLAVPLSQEDALNRVAHYVAIWKVLDVTGPVVLEAIRGVRERRLSFWDAQIWAVAKLNQVPMIFSEDFADGTVLEGVRFANPLRPGFRLADWL